MSTKKFAEALSALDSKYIEEAMDYQKKARKPGWLKWGMMAACMCLMVASLVAVISFYGNQKTEITDMVPAPMITVMGRNYFAPDMPVDELPAGYHYLRSLTAEEANNTQLEGCAIYIDPQDGDMKTIYLYQECGTPVGENTVDNTKRQWAYVKWTIYGTEKTLPERSKEIQFLLFCTEKCLSCQTGEKGV